jgi:Ca2+-binding EF-hand superfamily protein
MNASKLLIAGAAAALLPFAGAIAQSPTPDKAEPAQGQQQGATFESLDADSDGRISKTEASANENVSAQFSRYDKDGNGFIERAEVGATNTAPAEPSKP